MYIILYVYNIIRKRKYLFILQMRRVVNANNVHTAVFHRWAYIIFIVNTAGL